jgi:hypothetical protein
MRFTSFGNYIWTHYFDSLLVARYLFESYMLNNVPVVSYLCTYLHFPLYTYTHRFTFLTVGMVVYGIYVVVGFPMSYAPDDCVPAIAGANNSPPSPEKAQPPPAPMEPCCTVLKATQNALAAVPLLLDMWRLFIGGIYGFKGGAASVPFVYQPTRSRARRSFSASSCSCAPPLHRAASRAQHR